MTDTVNLASVAASLGLPCFPCNGDKHPITKGGFYAASRDPNAIASMFATSSAVMIGMPTGAVSGLVGIDVDVKEGHRGRDWLIANQHRLPPTRTHKTASGGLHLIFRNPEDFDIRNSQSVLHDGIDVRGNGGYLILPPSPGYSVADPMAPAEMPQWLIAACLKQPKPEAQAQPLAPRAAPISDRYTAVAVDGEIRAVSMAQPGTRNHQLNVSSMKLGQIVAAGLLDRSTAEAELTRAALAAGLDDVETRKTIASGMGFGMKSPRQVPERDATVLQFPTTGRGFGVTQAAQDFDPETGEVFTAPTPPAAGAQPLKPAKPGLPIVYFSEVSPNLDAADFVEGVLIEEAMSVVYGPSNCGKTFFATDLGMHIACGWPWRGREVEQGGVLYCALEGGHGISNRIAAFRAEHALQDANVPFCIVPVSINLLDPEADRQRVVDAVNEAAAKLGIPVKLIVIDTLARAMAGGNENAPDDMGALVSSVSFIQQAVKSHVMLIHHSGKDQAQGARGHSSLRAATDTEIEIGRENKDAPSIARVTKQRELEIDGTFAFTLKVIELGTNKRGKAVTSCIVVPSEEPAEAPRTRKLTGHTATAMGALRHVATQKTHGTQDIPAGYPAATITAWKEAFAAKTGELTIDARRVAFNNAKAKLQTEGLIGSHLEIVWIAERLS